MDAIESAICRVLRSVLAVANSEKFATFTARSPKSRSRYVTAKKGNRKLVIRISDHKNPAARCDIDIDYRTYNQKRLLARLNRKKNRNWNRRTR